MSLGELWAAINQQPRGSDLNNRALVELNQRFAMPVGAVLLCLMAMPLGLRPSQHGRTWGLILGLVVFLVYYIIFTAVLAPGGQRPDRSGAGAVAVQFSVYLGGPVSLAPNRAGTAAAAGGQVAVAPAMARCQGDWVKDGRGWGGKSSPRFSDSVIKEHSHSCAFSPSVKPEKPVLAGGTAFPGCARLTNFLDTGWKACATNLKNFSK